jgi:hypothetical protein
VEIGPYVVDGELGRGGMGVVYRARHARTGAVVALKVAGVDAPATAEQRARFRREAKLGATLDHPGIVRVLEHDAGGDPPWLAMELIEGDGLGAWATRVRPDWRTALNVIRRLAGALGAAHAAGVIHRDLKPGNVLWGRRQSESAEPARPFLTDFGLAKQDAAQTKLTATGDALGTPAYMSPEQARGELDQLGPASDLWSLGALLFELCAGRPAFAGESHAGVLAAVLHGPLPDPSALDVPAGVGVLIRGCVTRDPRRRYTDAAAFTADCDRVLAGERPHWRSATSRSTARGAAVASALALTCVVVAGPLALRLARARSAAEWDTQGWAVRHDAYGRALRLVGAAVEASPALHDAKLHLGLLRWHGGQPDHALAMWRSVPRGVPQRAAADRYIALLLFFHFRPKAERAAALARLPADHSHSGRIGGALRHIGRRNWAGAREVLRGLAGWEGALLRGYVESVDPNGDPSAACGAFDEAFVDGVRVGWAVYNRANSRARPRGRAADGRACSSWPATSLRRGPTWTWPSPNLPATGNCGACGRTSSPNRTTSKPR